jgi:hypothetical protein
MGRDFVGEDDFMITHQLMHGRGYLMMKAFKVPV